MDNKLKAVIFDFNGVIINDEPLHQKLLEQILIEENVRPDPGEYRDCCVGRSDRACLFDILSSRGRALTDAYIDGLIQRKSQAYLEEIATLTPLPIYPGLEDIIFQFRASQIPLAIVSGARRQEIEIVLNRSNLAANFALIVSSDEVKTSKPDSTGLLVALEQLQQQYPNLELTPANCLVIEDSPAGIEAAKGAGMSVVGVANTYPYHMIQRQANWTVDYLHELELDRIKRFFEQRTEAFLSASAVD
ncbi:MAG: HAD family phosphatase [Leptolyngbyaceae bacterium]|nr:HAD family phosphatase [Leptolyngbyaceae bacterium]